MRKNQRAAAGRSTMKTVLRRILLATAVLLVAACATTPASRIKKNETLFATFAPEAQETIRKGEIAIGFTPEMVEMAKDKPDREYTRRTAAGEVKVWSYTAFQSSTQRQRIEARVRAPDASGAWRSYTDWVWVDVQQQREYEQFRVEFVDGKVSAYESLER
jgi:hypothetical protein